jgi:hypothetical protein
MDILAPALISLRWGFATHFLHTQIKYLVAEDNIRPETEKIVGGW